MSPAKVMDPIFPTPALITSSPRLLIADDNESLLQVIQATLSIDPRAKLWRVDYARDGAQALAKYLAAYDEAPYDLLLFDNDMPEMSGPQAALAIRKSGDWDVPVVIYSAHLEKLKPEVRQEAGIAKELQKHDIISDMVTHLAQMLAAFCPAEDVLEVSVSP